MPTTCWGVTRRAWLGRQAFELPGQQQAFDDYLFAVDQIDRRIGALEAELDRLAQDGAHRELIARLRCMRGIDTLTALGLVCEVGDFSRFRTAEQFMSFVGLVPSERSSGDGRRQGSITKAGSSHARRLLVESAWNARRRPRSATSSHAATAARTPPCSTAPGAASSACINAGRRWPVAASPTKRSSSPAPASWPASCGQSPPTNP